MIAIAAMIAAVSFAVLAVAAVLLIFRLTTLLHDARHVIGTSDALLARANETVDRLERTEAVTASPGTLPGDCGCVHERAGTQPQSPERELPGGRGAAFVYGVRYAVGKRRGAARVTVPGTTLPRTVDNSKELAR